ncbi:hypothetical protein BGX28_007203 [Mortierella sp. GBA30]|nr:hypothetical protein BGX28_007203 [Mortierella sp. GBA30]
MCQASRISPSPKGEDNVIDQHLKMPQRTLNDGREYAVFFVISLKNGENREWRSITHEGSPSQQGDAHRWDLILTQIKKRNYDSVQSLGYLSSLLDILKETAANLRFLETGKEALVLCDYDDEFSDQELSEMQDYILTFKPGKD